MKTIAIAVLLIAASSGAALGQDRLGPNAITTLSVASGKTTAAPQWYSPGDQCTNATVTEYDLRYSTSTITECNFGDATRVTTGSPQSPNTLECWPLDTPGSLSCNTTYFWAVKSKDSSGNWSAISNVVSSTTGSCSQFTPEVSCYNFLRGKSGNLDEATPILERGQVIAPPQA